LGNPTLMEDLVAKLPTSKGVEWARHAVTIKPFPTIVDFSSWLTDYANVVCVVADMDGSGKEPRRRSGSGRATGKLPKKLPNLWKATCSLGLPTVYWSRAYREVEARQKTLTMFSVCEDRGHDGILHCDRRVPC